MNSRERVLDALNHREPDKVPIDLGGTICSTISATANDNLKEFLKINKNGEMITNPFLDVVLPLPEIMDLFETDCRTVRLKGASDKNSDNIQGCSQYSPLSLRDKPQGHFILDEYGTKWQKCGYDYSPVKYPLHDAVFEDLKTYKWPDPYNSGRVEGLREEAIQMHENTDFCIMADIMCGGPYENALWIRGFDQFPIDLMADKKFAHALLDKITEIDIGFWDAELTAVGEYVDVVCQGDDLGMQIGLQISPELYREMIKPYHKKLYSFIRSKTKAKIWMHSCGSVYDIIPDLIEVGVEVLNPVQRNAKNMNLEKLKKDFGKDISFWGGGFNVQSIPFMTIDAIESDIEKVMQIMAPGGGFVFSGTHNILPETKGESIYAAYMAAKKHRNY